MLENKLNMALVGLFTLEDAALIMCVTMPLKV